MKRVIWSTLAGLAVGASAVWAVAKFRPVWLGIVSRSPVVAETKPDDPPASALEDAPDDGWCGHRVKTPGEKPCPVSLPTVRLVSKATAGEIGLETTKAEVRKIAPTVIGNAEMIYATHEYAHVTSRVAGRVREIPKGVDEGKTVAKGTVLVIVDSAEVGSAKAQYLSLLPIAQLARETFARLSALEKTRAEATKTVLAAKAELNKAEADLMKARQQLLNMGFGEKEIADVERTKDTANFLDILAPMDGTLVERHAIVGEAVTPPSGLVMGQQGSLFEITDLRHLWCWIDVNESDVPKVAIDQKVTFTISGTDAPVFSGVVELIGFAVNPATRTVRVRAEVQNIDGRLRSNQFGRGVIQVGPARDAVVVPRSAVQQADSDEQFVFRPLEDGRRYRTQRVETRAADVPERVEIVWGVKPGQDVVTTGSFLLKTELFKASIGGD